VGKNCISIPVLQLPDRYHSSNEEETKERNSREVPQISGVKEIIEVEEVVVLTDNIQTLTLQDREDCYI
jgi:hypothetical protein